MASTMFGRKIIYSDYEEINPGNVIDMLTKTFPIHIENANQITYLWNYYLGKQPILDKTRELKPDSNAIVVENRANEIVSFKVGYLVGEPIQYVSRSEEAIPEINRLNSYLLENDKACLDEELATWFTVCGTSYRMVLPNGGGFPSFSTQDAYHDSDELRSFIPPFRVFTLDPRWTYVVYYSGIGNRPLCGVKYIVKQNGEIVISIYTDKLYMEIRTPAGSGIDYSIAVSNVSIPENTEVKTIPHTLGFIPIIEYPNNQARLGAFEPVLSILDAINEVASDRIDAVNDFVNALLVLRGVSLEEEEFKKLISLGGIQVPADGDVKYIVNTLNQSETQSLIDHMYQAVLTIVGLPNRNGGTSTSDTGQAVYLRDGFSAAETRAVSSENIFKRSEKQTLAIMLRCCNELAKMNLKRSDIEIRFTRRNYDNITGKADVLCKMLSTDKIHPKLAFAHSGMFSDPNLAYTESQKYYEEQLKKFAKENRIIDEEDADDEDGDEEDDGKTTTA